MFCRDINLPKKGVHFAIVVMWKYVNNYSQNKVSVETCQWHFYSNFTKHLMMIIWSSNLSYWNMMAAYNVLTKAPWQSAVHYHWWKHNLQSGGSSPWHLCWFCHNGPTPSVLLAGPETKEEQVLTTSIIWQIFWCIYYFWAMIYNSSLITISYKINNSTVSY